MKDFLMVSIPLILLQISSSGYAGVIPGQMSLEHIPEGLLEGGGPGGRFFRGPGQDGDAGMTRPGPGSRMGPNRGSGFLGLLGHRARGMGGPFTGMLPFGGGGLGGTVTGSEGGPFGGPIRPGVTSRPLFNMNGGGAHRPGSANPRSHPPIGPSAGVRFGGNSVENREDGPYDLSRKRKALSRERERDEHLRFSGRGPQEGTTGDIRRRRSEKLSAIGATRPVVTAQDDNGHGDGPEISRRKHGNVRSSEHGSNEEDDSTSDERYHHAFHKDGSVSISTYQALSLARQCLNLIHDMLVLLRSNRGT